MIRFLLLILCFSTLALPNYYRKWAKPFRLSKVNVQLPFSPQWETPSDPQIYQILEQPFRFIGKGFQSYAFLSKDGNYVLKLFRFENSKIGWLSKRPANVAEKMIDASIISFDLLREETGLLAVHLNPQDRKWPLIKVDDFLGFRHIVDPAKTRFVLQKRADKILPALNRMYKIDQSAFARMVQSFEDLLHSFEEKGITTLDSKMSNFGFIGEKAIQIDVASNEYNQDTSQIEVFRTKMKRWLGSIKVEGIAAF